VAAFATWYGFLETGGKHPSIKLGGAMALAGAGIVALLVARPVRGAETPGQDHPHSALAELHPLRLGLAWASMSAGLIHFAVIEQHLTEYWLYGWFFVVVATAQVVWAAQMVVKPFRLLLLAGAVGNALVVVAWIVTRTYGSLIGPQATMKSVAGFGDIVSTLLEAAIALGCGLLLARPGIATLRRHYPSELVNSLVSIGLVLLTSLSLYSSVGGSPFVSHVG